MITLNVRGLVLKKDRSKVKQLENIAHENNAAVIILTETWLDESVQSGEVAIQGYSLYRTDRDGRTRGGSCIYIRSNIPANPILQYSNGMVDTHSDKGFHMEHGDRCNILPS